ncbi:hypothetical protein [Pseudohalioglobus lutimaris]|nr:hypothetical protein [Pseudohalioglobus lutimaris]
MLIKTFSSLQLLRLLSVQLLLLYLAACANLTEEPELAVQSAEALQAHILSGDVVDDRGRFREVFCSVLEARGTDLPDYRSCDAALRSIGPEQGATGMPVYLGDTRADFLVLLVPGLGWNCFEEWLSPAFVGLANAAKYGYDVRRVEVDGLSSSASNAAMINDYVASLPQEDRHKKLILAGYSKGAPDILQALVSYPELAEKTVAVLALAGAVKGSPLAEDATQAQANMLSMVPGSRCEKEDGDNAAVSSLVPAVREQWLRDNPLPAHIRYYSAVAFPEPDRVSWALQKSYLLLGQSDSRNDTQLIVFDQIIPQSTVFALLNADHWAVAVPIARNHPVAGSTILNHNDYPREAFLEAVLRYLEEALH